MMEKLQEYLDMFGEGFPMMPLAWGRTEQEVSNLIDKCLKAGKDAYEMGMIKEDDDILY